MASLYKQKGEGKKDRWVVQANELPKRPRRFFQRKGTARAILTKIEIAIEKDDLAESERLISSRRKYDSIEDLIEAWLDLGQANRSQKQRQQKKARLTAALSAMGVDDPKKLTLDSAARYINSRVGIDAPKTINERVSNLRNFSFWLSDTQRIDRDRLRSLQRVKPRRTFVRRALSVEELTQIAAVTLVRPLSIREKIAPKSSDTAFEHYAAIGRQRLLLVATCFATGMRVGEVRDALTWGKTDLKEKVVRLRPEDVKTERNETVYLAPWLVRAFEEIHRQEIERLGAIPDPNSPIIKVDTQPHRWFIDDARVAELDPDDRDAKIDLHCLRHSIATWLTESGFDPYLADLFTRHCPQGSTRITTYLHARSEEMHKMAARVPNLLAAVSTLLSTKADTGEHGWLRLIKEPPQRNKPKPPNSGDLGLIEGS